MKAQEIEDECVMMSREGSYRTQEFIRREGRLNACQNEPNGEDPYI